MGNRHLFFVEDAFVDMLVKFSAVHPILCLLVCSNVPQTKLAHVFVGHEGVCLGMCPLLAGGDAASRTEFQRPTANVSRLFMYSCRLEHRTRQPTKPSKNMDRLLMRCPFPVDLGGIDVRRHPHAGAHLPFFFIGLPTRQVEPNISSTH